MITYIKEIIVITIVAAVLGFGVNLFHPRGYVLVSNSSMSYTRIVTISTEEAKMKFDAGNAIFVDSRLKEEYDVSHISNAVHIPALPESLSYEKIKANTSLLNQKKELLIYCDGEGCGSSEILARRIVDAGYSRNVYILRDGLPDWKRNKYTAEGSAKE